MLQTIIVSITKARTKEYYKISLLCLKDSIKWWRCVYCTVLLRQQTRSCTVVYSPVQSTLHSWVVKVREAECRVAVHSAHRADQLSWTPGSRSQEGLSNPEPVCLNVNTVSSSALAAEDSTTLAPETGVWSEVKWASSDECEQEVGDHQSRLPKWLQDCLVSFEGCVLHSWFSASAS